MDITDLFGRLLRLRLAVAAVVVLALVAGAIGFRSAGQSRQAGAALVILPPKVSSIPGGENPLLNLDSSLTQLAVVLSAALQSGAVSDALERADATAGFTVSTVIGDNPSFAQLSPQLVFRVNADNAALVTRTLLALIDQAGQQLAALQARAGVASSERATLLVVVAPTTPELVAGGRLRAAGALGVGVGVLLLLLLLVVDALLRRRRRTTDPAAESAVEPADEPTVAEPIPAEPAAEPAAQRTTQPATTLVSAQPDATNGSHPATVTAHAPRSPNGAGPAAHRQDRSTIWRERQERAASLARRVRAASGRRGSSSRQ